MPSSQPNHDVDPDVVVQCIDSTWHAWKFVDGHIIEAYSYSEESVVTELNQLVMDYEERNG
jgi:hypothetical protein